MSRDPRDLSAQALRDVLAAAPGQQLFPVPLMAQVRAHLRAAGHTVSPDVAELALYHLMATGELEWTRVGPVRRR